MIWAGAVDPVADLFWLPRECVLDEDRADLPKPRKRPFEANLI